MEINIQRVIQDVFEVGNRFWAHKNQHPNFDKLTKNKVLNKQKANRKRPPMYIKHCKPVFKFVFVIIEDFLHLNIS